MIVTSHIMVKLNIHIKSKTEIIKLELKLIYFIKLIKNTYIFDQ